MLTIIAINCLVVASAVMIHYEYFNSTGYYTDIIVLEEDENEWNKFM